MSSIGALPARFRRPRILIIGCGDVGVRAAEALGGGRRARLLALTSTPARAAELRARGIQPLLGDLDHPDSLKRLAGLGQRVLHLAPPPSGEHNPGRDDPRTRALMRAFLQRSSPVSLVYGSTTGVYGDRQGQWVDETTAVRPTTARAQRRVDAEQLVRDWGRVAGVRTTVLRIPGIYAPNRENGTPRARLQRGTPVLRAEDDVFTHHIHADDLARACALALWRGPGPRTVNVTDDTAMSMGDYFDLAADLYGLPRPPRVSRAEAERSMPPMALSFMSESRRLTNRRMKRELGLRLRYPTVVEGLRE